MCFIYILFSPEHDKFYVGSTNDFTARLKQHNLGQSNYTRNYIPWEPALVIEKATLSEARVLENKLKRLNKDRIRRFIDKYK